MDYTVQKYPEEPIVEFAVTEQFRVYDHLPDSIEDARKVLDNLGEDIYYVVDAGHLRLDFSGAVAALAMLAKGKLALFKHPRIHKIVVAGKSRLLEMSMKALGQAQYGGLTVYFYHTIEEALTAVRAEIGGVKKMVSTF